MRLRSLDLRALDMKFASLAQIDAAISSNCGNVKVFKGATRDLAITSEL